MISLDLPKGFETAWEDVKEGKQQYIIRTGKQRNNKGETVYEFQMTGEIVSIEDDKIARGESVIDVLARRNSDQNVIISRDRSAIAMTRKAPIRILGNMLKYYGILVEYSYTTNSVFCFSHITVDNDDSEENALIYERVLTVIKAVRLRGKCPDFNISNAKELERKLKPIFDSDENTVGGLGLKISIGGNEIATFDGNGEKIESYPRAFLIDDVLHEHHDLSESSSYSSHADADFVGQSILMLMREQGNQFLEEYSDLENSGYYNENEKAIELAKVFRLSSNLFDPYHDTEALIRRGMFSKARMFSALRSLAWTVGQIAENDSRDLQDFTFEELQSIGEHVANCDYINYNDYKSFQGLCDHPDWHVFYIPEDFGSEKDMRYLCGKENRGGNTSSMYIHGRNDRSDIQRINQIISRNEETCASLDALRNDLIDLEPVMQTIHDGFMINRNRSEQLEGPLADALIAWCALCIAAKEPFYSEEAADTPEANTGLKEPLHRPTDSLPNSKKDKIGTVSAARKSKPSASNILDLGGKSTIKSGQFQENMQLKNIVIPEGVTEIGDYAFYQCMLLESVVFPKSLRKIGDFAFMGCRALNRVEFKEGIRELGDHVFGACSSLLRVEFPDSLEKVNRMVFGLGGNSPYATAYMSGETAKRLGDVYARHLVIDGQGYDSIKDYLGVDYQENPTYHAPAKSLEQKTSEWMERYGQYVSHNPQIQFDGKLFVFNGFGSSSDMDEPLVQAILSRGGLQRKSISGKTDFLVVDPAEASESKIKLAIEQINKGGKIKIVLKHDIEDALSEKKHTTAAPQSPQPSAKQTVKNAASKKDDPFLPKPVLADPNDCKIKDDCLIAYKGSAPHLILPDEIQSIDSWSFASNKTLVSVVIPEGIEEIAEGAFSMCDNLENVTLPNTIKTIGNSAFSRCKKLKSIAIPDGCETLGDGAFNGCGALENITLPDTLRTIGEEAFCLCENLKEIFIPDGCETIREWAFKWCENIHVYIPDSVYEIGEDAFDVLSTNVILHTVQYSAADSYAKKNELKVKYDYYSFKQQELRSANMDTRSNLVKTQSGKNDVTDAVDTDLYFILNNEKLLGKLNRSDDDFYTIYSEDFPQCGKKELLLKRREILNSSKGDFSIPKQHMDAFRARCVEKRFSVATANLFNVNNSIIDFDEKARKAIEQTRDFYTSAEADEVRRLMDQRLKDTRAEIDRQYDVIEPRWKTYNGAKNDIKVCLVDPDTSEREEDCIFQRESDNALVMIKMSKPEMSFFAVRLINCMAWYWKVTPQKIWEQALQNGIEDQRSHSFGNASKIAQRAFAETFPEVVAVAERAKAQIQQANEQANAKEKHELIQRLERTIRELENERDNLRGLFKGRKRKKIQAQIDELQNELISLK